MFRLRKLDIFITKQFGLLFVGTFFICQFVLMMQFLWKHVDTLIGKGLSLDVLAQFFWNMGLMLVPQAMPLAILLSALITFGNLGESSELTAIKAAGISLFQSFRPLIVLVTVIASVSFYFQNVIGPNANMELARMLISMKQKSPELEIPEGIFYDGIPGSNLYVQKKDLDTGMLYGIMIYRITNSYEDAAIILADSGMLQSTAEKKHLLLTLHSGEWFENMKSQEMAGNAGVPYRRETFIQKKIVLDFDADFNMLEAGALSNNAKGKSLRQLAGDTDSLRHVYDSIGRSYYQMTAAMDAPRGLKAGDSLRATRMAATKAVDIDSIFGRLSPNEKRDAVSLALSNVREREGDYEFKKLVTADGDKLIRQHQLESIKKFTLALSCIIFFFIGAPLGAIIRKGGLGFPVIISVLVFIIYYIFDSTGYKMARSGMWTIWFGQCISTVALTPLAIFVTYKANNDSAVFNIDAYRNALIRLLALRVKRNISPKEVVITDPSYGEDAARLARISEDIELYSRQHHLLHAPSVKKVFFVYEPDNEIERINDSLEAVIEDLANSKDKAIINALNDYPVIATKAHTRPFEARWKNIAAAIAVPVGAVLYLRMWRFRLRLHRDLKAIAQTNSYIISRIGQ